VDEPAAGLNGQETAELLEIIRKLKQMGYTIFDQEHDMKFV
jgi:branched-chain amino acid transport system ATP-binding protein